MAEHNSLLASLPRDLEEMERTLDPDFLGSRLGPWTPGLSRLQVRGTLSLDFLGSRLGPWTWTF